MRAAHLLFVLLAGLAAWHRPSAAGAAVLPQAADRSTLPLASPRMVEEDQSHSPTDPASLPQAARRAAQVLASGVEKVRSATPGPAGIRSAHQAAGEAHDILEAAGCEEKLASALCEIRTVDDERHDDRRAALHGLQTARRRLLAFAEAAEAPAPPLPPGARQRLETLLDDPVFRTETPQASLLTRWMDRLRRAFLAALLGLGGALASHSTILRVLVVIMLLAALAVAVRLVAPLLTRRGGRVELRSFRADPAPSGKDEPILLLEEALAAAGAGQALRAVKLFEKAAVLALRRQGALPGIPGLTDLEGVGALAGRTGPETRVSFQRLAALHDRGVYARRGLEPSDLEEAARLARTLVQPAAETAP